jgi:hypothetical protein
MPGLTGVHIDRELSNVSVKFKNPSFMADVIAPPVTVKKESDRYWVYGKENFRIPFAVRADKAMTQEITHTLTTEAYVCQEYGFHTLVSDRERENADEGLGPDIDATELVTDCLLLDKEYRTANYVLDSTNPDWQPGGAAYNTSHFTNLDAAWDDRIGADPRADIYYGRYVIYRDARVQPNSIFLPVEVSMRLAQMDQIDELRKYTDPGLVTNSGIPGILYGLKVYECQASYNGAEEASTTSSFTEVFGNNVLMSYIRPGGISIKSLTFALSFQKQAFQTRKWREERRKADAIEVGHIYTTKIIAPACGFVMTNTITSTVG